MMTDRINVDKEEFKAKSASERATFLSDLQDMVDADSIDFTLDGADISIDDLYEELDTLNQKLNGKLP